MSIQDDIFDVEHALEGKPEKDGFDRIHTYIGNLERELEIHRLFYIATEELRNSIKQIENKKF